MTDSDDVRAPHAAAQMSPDEPSRAANQLRAESMPATPADEDTPATSTDQPDAAADDGLAVGPAPSQQAGVADDTTTSLTPATGTSESMAPVEGIHRPDVGPGGEQLDTAERPAPNRTTGSR